MYLNGRCCMAETQTKLFCPVCGNSGLDDNQGTLYCPRCQIFVGRTTTYNEFSQKHLSRPGEDYLHAKSYSTPVSVDFLGSLIAGISGMLPILAGAFLLSTSAVAYYNGNIEGTGRVIGFAALLLFFGIVFYKIGGGLKKMEGGAWAAGLVLHLVLLYILGGPAIRTLLDGGMDGIRGMIETPRGALELAGLVYPAFISLYLLVVVRHFR